MIKIPIVWRFYMNPSIFHDKFTNAQNFYTKAQHFFFLLKTWIIAKYEMFLHADLWKMSPQKKPGYFVEFRSVKFGN